MDIPVNMKFCFEGMEESGSEGLDDLLFARKDTEFMQKVDYVRVHHMFSRILNFLFNIFFSRNFLSLIRITVLLTLYTSFLFLNENLFRTDKNYTTNFFGKKSGFVYSGIRENM